MKIPKKVEVKYHYGKEDWECSGDFYEAEIYFDKKAVLELTDDYHDGTSRQFEGFLEACRLIWGKKFQDTIIESHKNDSDY